jgi:WD40 repeat protein
MTRDRRMTPGTLPRFDGWALLDLESGSVIRAGRLPGTWLFDDFSPDGVHVAVSLFSGRVWILDTRTGRAVDIPRPIDQKEIYRMGWSSDGSQLVSTDAGGILGLVNTTTDTLQSTVTVPGDTMAVGQFRPGTRDVTLFNTFGQVFTWDTRSERAIAFGCRIAGRDMTPDEWRTYVGIAPQFQVCPA